MGPRATVDAYLRNLAQITQIFWLTVMGMLLGSLILIVGWGIVEALSAAEHSALSRQTTITCPLVR